MIQEVTAHEYFMGEINRRRNGVSTSFHETSIGSICLPRRWKNDRIRLGEGLCVVIQNRRELWKAMESQETPKGWKKSFSVHPWAPLPRWKVPVFCGLLSSHLCLLLLLFFPRLAVSCIFVFLTPPPWCLFFERKGGTELNFHLRADGWVTDIKVGPDHQGSLKMRAASGTEVQPSQELSAFLNPSSWNTCSQLFRRNWVQVTLASESFFLF